MSNVGLSDASIDPLAGLGDVPGETAREYLATLVKGDGISITDANTILAGKGFAPLNTNSVEYASAQKEAMLNDAEFIKAYSNADPTAIAALFQADLRLQNASGKLTDRPMAPTDTAYDALRREVGYNVAKPEVYEVYSNELAGLASSIGMPPSNAASLAEQHFNAIKAVADMSAEERANWGENQARDFEIALGPDPEATIKAANKILSEKSGKTLDLAKIVRSNGAALATNLLFQAQSLQLNTRK